MSRLSRSLVFALLLVAVILPVVPVPTGAVVAWPPSPDLVIGEVVTGGAKGSDEYLELFNGGTAPAALDGLEVVYATASGKTVTRKQQWTGRALPAGGRLLIANGDGSYAAAADHTYSGGLSGTGGSLVLRVVGGDVVDSLSWGSAASVFVEGTAAPAPAAGSSIERRPGGSAGNGRDTNDNLADTVVNPAPVAQGADSGVPPTPAPTQKPTPKPTSPSTPKPTIQPTLEPTPLPTPIRTPQPTDTPIPNPTAPPSPRSTVVPAPTATPSVGTLIADARRLVVGDIVTVSGTVTAEPGRLLGERTMAIADGSGGLFVRLPSGYPVADVPRGAIVEVSGPVAMPYGNLELRPAGSADVVLLGSGGLPAPQAVTSETIGEATEGHLSVLTGTVVRVDRRSKGALSVLVRDELGTTTVYVHAPLAVQRSAIPRKRQIRVTGIVGQRASRSGAADGHRVWPRDRADIELLPKGGPGASTPPGDGSPADGRPRKARIKAARIGQPATIVGTVTTRAGFIDGDGRRVTVQDGSGAILVRYPVGVRPPKVGSVIRAWGDVGTWFGSRQLEAAGKPKRKGKRRVKAATLQRPPTERDEWRLVAVNIRIVDVERDGETWRAEAVLGDRQGLPIVGLAGSGIASDTLEEGRLARITGIVRRAYPTASDQRFAVAPRSAGDIALGRLLDPGEDDAEVDDGDDGLVGALGAAGGGGSALMTTSLASLPRLTDQHVRVGGRLERIRGRRLTLDDGTAQAAVRLLEDVEPIEPELSVGEVVNVRGRVRGRSGGAPEVVVDSASDVQRAALRLESRSAAADLPIVTEPDPNDAPTDSVAGGSSVPLLPLAVGLALLLLAALALGGAVLSWWYGSRPQHRPAAGQVAVKPKEEDKR